MRSTHGLWMSIVGSAFFGTSTELAGDEKIPLLELGGKIDWVYSYEEGKRRGRETGKPLFVVFRCER